MGRFMVRTQKRYVLCVCTKFEADIFIRSKVIRGTKISKLGHVTRPRPLRGRFMVHAQEGCVFYAGTKFEADSSIRSKVIRGPKITKLVK